MNPDALDAFSALSALTEDQKAALCAALSVRTLPVGATLFAQGDAADACFFLLGGGIEVRVPTPDGGAATLTTLAPGELFGEVALLDGGPRSATCAAGPQGAEVAALRRVDFEALFERADPVAHALLDTLLERLAARLRGATTLLMETAAR